MRSKVVYAHLGVLMNCLISMTLSFGKYQIYK